MTMRYVDDHGYGIGHLNDDLPLETRDVVIEWTPDTIAIAERLADWIGLPGIFRYWREGRTNEEQEVDE